MKTRIRRAGWLLAIALAACSGEEVGHLQEVPAAKDMSGPDGGPEMPMMDDGNQCPMRVLNLDKAEIEWIPAGLRATGLLGEHRGTPGQEEDLQMLVLRARTGAGCNEDPYAEQAVAYVMKATFIPDPINGLVQVPVTQEMIRADPMKEGDGNAYRLTYGGLRLPRNQDEASWATAWLKTSQGMVNDQAQTAWTQIIFSLRRNGGLTRYGVTPPAGVHTVRY